MTHFSRYPIITMPAIAQRNEGLEDPGLTAVNTPDRIFRRRRGALEMAIFLRLKSLVINGLDSFSRARVS